MVQRPMTVKRYKPGKSNKQLPHLDGRTKASQRFKMICKNLTVDLGHEPNVAEAALIRQAAAAIVVSELAPERSPPSARLVQAEASADLGYKLNQSEGSNHAWKKFIQ
jgi:hypothetical protein